MTYDDGREQAGLAIIEQLGWGQNDEVKALDEDLWRIISEANFGTIWARPGLSLHLRDCGDVRVDPIRLYRQCRIFPRERDRRPDQIIEGRAAIPSSVRTIVQVAMPGSDEACLQTLQPARIPGRTRAQAIFFQQ